MCGIAGFVGKDFNSITQKMTETLGHRGPDDEGFFFDRDCQLGFGHKRLSIVDVEFGHQPLLSDDGDLALIFNGEIFNAPTLRKSLESKGIKFLTDHSDTEVLLQMYRHYGPKMVSELNGMFSFVFFDRQKAILFGARDPFGIKPFFYSKGKDFFAFSSEVKSLLNVNGFSKSISHEAVSHYLSFQCIPSPWSIYEGINKLPAAHLFFYDLTSRELHITRYWRPTFKNTLYKEDELLEEIRNKVEGAVKQWCMSDVEFGCSLSGGLDSSVITTLATKNFQKLKTFTVGFEGFDLLDERQVSSRVAHVCKTQHHEVIVTENHFASELPLMVQSLDEPYGGGLPSWFIYKEMSKHVKVCLTGTGGDELFGNYGKWRPFLNWRDYLFTIRKNWNRVGINDILKHPIGSLYWKYFTDYEKAKILKGKKISSSSLLAESYWYSFGAYNSEDGVVSVDIQLQLPEEFLNMTDRFSMHFSMEARTPFLDAELVDFVYSISPNLRTSKADPKSLLRKAFKDLLPKQVIEHTKRGFVLPIDAWMKSSFKDEIDEFFSPEYLKKQGIFDASLSGLIHKHMKDEYGIEKIWTLLMFQFWYAYVYNSK